MRKIEAIESTHLKKDIPKFKPGDTLRVYVQIKEEDKLRIQVFEGMVIGKRGQGLKSSFTIRKVSYGEGVERTFLLHSPLINKIELAGSGKIRKAKLYYLRKKTGKRSKVAQKLG